MLHKEQTDPCEQSCAKCNDGGDCSSVRAVLQEILGNEYSEERATAIIMIADDPNLHKGVPESSQIPALFFRSIIALMNRRTNALEKKSISLEKKSITDELTGLLNRRGFMDRLKSEMARAERGTENIGLLMIDIDYFKNLNDTYGHQFGDLVLKEVTRAISENTRKYDITGRYGGEEIIVALPGRNLTEEKMKRVAENIRNAVAALRFKSPDGLDSNSVSVTVSIGCEMFLPEAGVENSGDRVDEDIGNMIQAADQALYSAKNGGRNRVEVAETPVSNIVSFSRNRVGS